MELKVFDRLILLNILPREGDYLTLKIVRKLREDLSFSEGEHKSLQIRQEEGKVFWVQEADIPKDISIGEKVTDIIVETLKRLDKEKKLQIEHMAIYEKFLT